MTSITIDYDVNIRYNDPEGGGRSMVVRVVAHSPIHARWQVLQALRKGGYSITQNGGGFNIVSVDEIF